MRTLTERNVDAEILASLNEEDELFQQLNRYTNESKFPSQGNGKEVIYDAAYWTRKLRDNGQEQNLSGYRNPFTELGNTKESESKTEPGILERAANWISDHPGTAILAALLIGGGAYLLAKHLRGSNSDSKEKRSFQNRSRKNRARKEAMEQGKDTSPEENMGYSITPKEIAIGAVTATGGALLGTVLEDYSMVAAIPVAALGLTRKNIPIIAAAIGFVLSGTIRDIFQYFFNNETSKKEKEDMKKKGYIETILGFMKPDRAVLSDS